MSNFKRGDKITVKGYSYGSTWVSNNLVKVAGNRKCAMVEIIHSSTDEKCFDDVKFGLTKTVRLIDVRASK